MKINPYLTFKGDCEAAFEAYARILGGRIVAKMTHGEMPPEYRSTADWADKILHIHLAIGDEVLMGSDAPPQFQVEAVSGFQVSIQAESVEEARRLYDALSQDGEIAMPLAETFWSPAFAMFRDRFGTPWMINAVAAA